MSRYQYLDARGVRLAYLDFGGNGAPLVALHGLFGRGRLYTELAVGLAPEWRVVAPDQRGHGLSGKAQDYSREAYVGDVEELIRRLNLAPAVVYGHSLGGVTAYQLAARCPELVRALVIEDVGTVIVDDMRWTLSWPRRFPTLAALRQCLAEGGFKHDVYLTESAVEYDDGWGFRFETEEMVRTQAHLMGNHWADWLGSRCPALLMAGGKSWVLKPEHAREMAARRSHTTLVEFPKLKHAILQGDPAGCVKAVRAFLSRL
jgi:esterase